MMLFEIIQIMIPCADQEAEHLQDKASQRENMGWAASQILNLYWGASVDQYFQVTSPEVDTVESVASKTFEISRSDKKIDCLLIQDVWRLDILVLDRVPVWIFDTRNQETKALNDRARGYRSKELVFAHN